jgi:hypothetical protein
MMVIRRPSLQRYIMIPFIVLTVRLIFKLDAILDSNTYSWNFRGKGDQSFPGFTSLQISSNNTVIALAYTARCYYKKIQVTSVHPTLLKKISR